MNYAKVSPARPGAILGGISNGASGGGAMPMGTQNSQKPDAVVKAGEIQQLHDGAERLLVRIGMVNDRLESLITRVLGFHDDGKGPCGDYPPPNGQIASLGRTLHFSNLAVERAHDLLTELEQL